MSPLEQLKSVLCDPEGKCCITGSDEDRAIVDRALQALAQPEQKHLAKVEPCVVCGEGKAKLLVVRSCDTCHSEYAGQAEMKVALGKPEQEPVAWEQFYPDIGKPQLRQEPSITKEARGTLILHSGWDDLPNGTKFYTTPPKRPWVGLTDEKIAEVAERMEASDPTDSFWREFARAIEAAHGITGEKK